MKKKKYSTPSMRIVKIANSHLLSGSQEKLIKGDGSDYGWGDGPS